jgi:hypothetical protein
MSIVVQAVANGLAARKQKLIRFPETEESIGRTEREFHSIKEFLNVISAISRTCGNFGAKTRH